MPKATTPTQSTASPQLFACEQQLSTEIITLTEVTELNVTWRLKGFHPFHVYNLLHEQNTVISEQTAKVQNPPTLRTG